MLYVTTRNSNNTFSAHNALTESVAPDGGVYIPFALPAFDKDQIDELLGLGFCECIAAILNRLFSCCVSPWDVETCIGRTPGRIATVGRKIFVAENWHTPGGTYEHAVSALNDILMSGQHESISNWTRVAISIAYLFATCARMRQKGLIGADDSFDVSVMDGDFTLPAAALYCTYMGLPINRVLICSKRNSAIWDLVNHGKIGSSLLLPNQKIAFERLVFTLLGQEQTNAYVAACQRHGVYSVPDDRLDVLPAKLFGAVIGSERIDSVISNVFKTNGYKLSTDTAVCFAGIQDYRAKTGQGGTVILWGSDAPEN